MDNKNKSIVPIDPKAYENVGTTLKLDSNINSNVVDQINNNSMLDIPKETDYGYSIIDVDSLGGTNQYYDIEQSNSRKNMNARSSIVNQYHNISNDVIDEANASSYEDQINNSKDLVFYTQQPKPHPPKPQPQQPNINNQIPVQPMNQFGIQNYNQQPIQMQQQPYPDYNNQQSGMMQQPYPNYNQQQVVVEQSYPNYNNQPEFNNTVPSYYSPMGFPSKHAVAPGAQIHGVPGSANDSSLHTNHRETIGPEAFKKKMKKNVRPFNFLLVIIYLLILGLIGYFGYNLWMDRQVFTISRQKMNLALGSSYQEKVYVRGELDSNDNYFWKSQDETIVKVDDKGNITSLKEGTTIVTVTNKKTKKKIDITVKVIAVQLYQFDIKESEKVIYMNNNSYKIVPLINEQSSLTIDLEWSNSNTTVVSVSDEGVVTPLKPGRATITVSIPNTKFRDSITIIVVEKK